MSEIAQAASEAGTAQRHRIDWKYGAQLLVAGQRPAEVADALGIPEDRLWKHLSRSLRFATHIRRAMERQRLLAQIQYPALQAQRMHDALAQDAAPPDLQWLSDAIGPAEPTNDNANDLVRQLQDTAGRYPSQALRRRLAAEHAALEVAILGSGGPDKPQIAPDKHRTVPDKTETAPDKTQIALDKTQTAPDKTQTVSDRPATPSWPPPHPRLPPRYTGPPSRNPPTIVDLTDLDGNPLPGAEWPEPREKG